MANLQTKVIFMLLLAIFTCAEHPNDKTYDNDDTLVTIWLNHRPKTCDRESKKGDFVKVNFNVVVHDKTQTPIDNRFEKKTLEFVLGDKEMIEGFEAGLYDMCVGESRSIVVPPKFGYRGDGLGSLPSRVHLHFKNVTMRFIGDNPKGNLAKDNIFKQIDSNEDSLLSKDEVSKFLLSTGVRDVPGATGMKQLLREIFHEEDHDHNGFIAHHEFGGIKDEL